MMMALSLPYLTAHPPLSIRPCTSLPTNSISHDQQTITTTTPFLEPRGSLIPAARRDYTLTTLFKTTFPALRLFLCPSPPPPLFPLHFFVRQRLWQAGRYTRYPMDTEGVLIHGYLTVGGGGNYTRIICEEGKAARH